MSCPSRDSVCVEVKEHRIIPTPRIRQLVTCIKSFRVLFRNSWIYKHARRRGDVLHSGMAVMGLNDVFRKATMYVGKY